MKIIQRHKDSTGRVVGYTVEIDREQVRLGVEQTASLKDKITNATLLSNGEFKAKAGQSIKTVGMPVHGALHNYIDVNLVHDYSQDIDFDTVIDEVIDTYTIKNIFDDDGESVYYLSQALYEDYITQRANYRAYIEKDMDARVLMELRKSAVLPMAEDSYDFYTGHKTCNTVADIKAFRTQYLKFLNKDYFDLNWQYFYITKVFLGKKAHDYKFDYESCFADGDFRKETCDEDYITDAIKAHKPPENYFSCW